MARRMSKAESSALGLLVLIGLPIYFAAEFFKAVGWVIPAVIAAIAIVLYFAIQQAKHKNRLSYLRSKYSDEEVVRRIMGQQFWPGQTSEQLTDSLGPPVEIDNKLLKTRTREVWKYQQTGSNRFALRITVEDGLVTGWDQKA